MSKKSRKRNKKILAAIGLGLGAAALASKKKAALGSTEDGKGGIDTIAKAKQSMTSDKAYSPPKKDTAKKNIPQETKVNTGAKDKVRMTSANVQSKKIDAPYKGFNFGDGVKKRRAEEANFNAKVKKINNPAVTGTTLPGMKSGGRAGYKSGGSIKKSMGKALRGGGKVIR